jgi:hypothetical protein
MPTYDYVCESNGKVVEVKHGINEQLSTWGEICARVGIAPGDTPEQTPVKRLITGGGVVKSSNLGSAPPCQSGAPCCGGGGCGMS